VTLKEWVRGEPGELPTEIDAPETVPPGEATVLIPYGALFYAASHAFEECLPDATDETRHAVVILSLRQRDDLGSTIFNVLERYNQELQAHDSLLMLVEVSDKSMQQFEDTGHVDIFGRDYIFRSTERAYESTREALHQADKWIAEQKEAELEKSE
jgi:SulP family sulfate permease